MEGIEQIQALMVEHRWPVAGALFFFGSMVGSFLNVVIHRLPDDEQSIVKPRSRCPACGQTIRWYDNIPILSFLILRARCRACSAHISWRYPLVEALTGFLLVALFFQFGPTRAVPIHFAFTAALVAISFIDFDLRIIPNEISLPGILVGFGCSFLAREGFWIESLIGAAVGGGGLLLISLAFQLIRGKEGMGMGDVKLLGMLGAWLGWRSLLFIVMWASLQGVAVTVVLWLIPGVKLQAPLPEEWEEEEAREKQREREREEERLKASPEGTEGIEAENKEKEEEEEEEEEEVGFMGAAIPFGPFLALAAVEYLFFGQIFFDWLAGR